MIYIKLFFTFLKIGLFNFGGGYAMISFLQNEVVYKQAWLSTAEFTDIVAISQVTPGPVGINLATYTGYATSGSVGGMFALIYFADFGREICVFHAKHVSHGMARTASSSYWVNCLGRADAL